MTAVNPVPSVAFEDLPPEVERQRLRAIALMVAPFAGLTLFFLGWEIYVRVSGVRPLTLPKPSSVLVHVVENPGFYWHHATVTVQEAWWGFWMAFVLAVVVATAMAHSKLMERAATPIIVLMQSMPVAILVPIFLLWFGFSVWPKILTALLFAWIPFVANALTGLRAIDA